MRSKPGRTPGRTLGLRAALVALVGAALLAVGAVPLPGDIGVIIERQDNNHVHTPPA